MPEGPEIRIEADRIAAVLTGETLESVWFARADLQKYANHLRGRTVNAIDTRGKAMLTRFDNGQVLYTHNQLYGRWFVRPRGDFPTTARSLRVALHTGTSSALLYSASEIELLDTAALDQHPFLSRLGPDALDPELHWRELAQRFDAQCFRARTLHALLLDQRFLAGIGNYLRSEILHCAGLRPDARPRDLEQPALNRLARSALTITRRAYTARGVTNPARRVSALKRAGATRGQLRFAVFSRDGQPCYACGATIERTSRGGRRLYFCPDCQSAA